MKTWVYRITQNTALDHVRKTSTICERKTHSIFGDTDDSGFFLNIRDESIKDPSEIQSSVDDNSLFGSNIQKTLQKLSPIHKNTILLAFKEGYSYEKLAKTMKCSIGTVMSRVFYARKSFIKNYKIFY